jgi:hypothetical protein
MKRMIVAVLGIAALLMTGVSEGAKPGRKPNRQFRPNKANMVVIDYEFTVLNDARVRLMKLPVEFDEKGQPKKYVGEELKKLKGTSPAEQKMMGYKSDFGVLKPGDVVRVSFSRPKNAKDLEKTSWSPLAGSMLGIITNVETDKDARLMTLRVSPNGPPPTAGDNNGRRKKRMQPDAPKNVIKPAQRQASMIVIVEQAPDPEYKAPKRGKKKKK